MHNTQTIAYKNNILSPSFLGGTETNTMGNRKKFQLWVLVAFQANYVAEKAFLKTHSNFQIG